MFCYVYIKKQEKQQDVLIKALDVFLICPVVFKKGADVLKFPVVKCEQIGRASCRERVFRAV